MQQGICDICGRVAVLQTCPLCGKRVCELCIKEGVCKVCLRGKFYENSEVVGVI